MSIDSSNQNDAAFPCEIIDESTWHSPQMAGEEAQQKWLYIVTKTDISELTKALQIAKQKYHESEEKQLTQGQFICTLTKQDFPLPHFESQLHNIREAVLKKHGFFLIRGLPLDQWEHFDACVVYYGICLYMGEAVSQNAQGHVFTHITDTSEGSSDTRFFRTHHKMRFHTDSSDVVGLLCLNPSKTGGESSVCSSMAIFNEMGRRCPELLKVLCEPFWSIRKQPIPDGEAPFCAAPIFDYYEDYLNCTFNRHFIETAQERFPTDLVPRITPTQRAALNMFEEIAEEPNFRLQMKLRRGDIQFVHNLTNIHARERFTDSCDPALKRHLIRLKISVEGNRPLPETFKGRWGRIGAVRGGFEASGVVPTAQLNAT